MSASKNRLSKCDGLSIERRCTQKTSVVLLITNGSNVVAQFPLPNAFLFDQRNPIKDAGKTLVFRRGLVRKDGAPRWRQIKDLRIGMKSVDLKAEVVEIAEPKSVVTRFGNYASVANALISDETGKVKM